MIAHPLNGLGLLFALAVACQSPVDTKPGAGAADSATDSATSSGADSAAGTTGGTPVGADSGVDSDGICEPDCGARECGADPSCGESCGSCGTGEGCSDAGICEAFDPSAFYYRVEAPERIDGPGAASDTVFTTLITDEGVFGYTANSTTTAWYGASLDTLSKLAPPALEPGGAGAFDECGTWLNSVRTQDSAVFGWYHAEEACTPPNTHKSVAYVESSDGGRTFDKVGYPDNRVLTADARYDGDAAHDDAGDPCIVDVDGFHYMYFLATSDWGVHLARAPLGGGGPGGWTKYFEGGFTEPGLGGSSTAIPGLAGYTWVSLDDRFGQQLMGITIDDSWSLTFAFSSDGLSFSPVSSPVLPLEDQDWARTSSSHELVAYPSLVSLNGDSQHVDDDFWLYFTYLLPSEGFDRRYLLRRRLARVAVDPEEGLGAASRLALLRTRSEALGDDWVTTVQLDDAYTTTDTMGYLLSEGGDGTVEVTGCYIEEWTDHLVSVNGDCGGTTYVRRLGYALITDGPGRVAVYRCYDGDTTNHFLSTDAACEGATTEWQLGYLLTD